MLFSIKKIDQIRPDICIDSVLDEFGHHEQFTLIIEHLWESLTIGNSSWTSIEHYLGKLQQLVRDLKTARPRWRILLLINSWWLPHKNIIQSIDFDDVLYLDFFLYRTYQEIFVNKRSRTAYRWPAQAKKFLCLTFVPTRFHRIRLITKIMEQNLDTCCEWSLHLNDSSEDSIRAAESHALVPEMTKVEFDNFLKKYHKSPDSITYLNISNNVTYGGIPYDVKLFSETKFSIVSETFFNNTDNAWITEKTWISIANNHPFIIAGDTNSLCKLHRMGFVTYEKFLKIKDYDTINNSEARLNAVVENAASWINNIDQHQDQIKNATAHNLSMLEHYYETNRKLIEKFIQQNNLDTTAEKLVNTSGQHQTPLDPIKDHQLNLDKKFVEFYKSIKDPSWPECQVEADFKNLPKHIQKECIQIFGYVPPN